jgi:hypothetical protein
MGPRTGLQDVKKRNVLEMWVLFPEGTASSLTTPMNELYRTTHTCNQGIK